MDYLDMGFDMPRYEQADFERFFVTASLVLDIARDTAKTLNESLAPEFCLAGLLMPDEVRLSRVIAELLNPSGSHGQGLRFLHAFLDEIETPGSAVVPEMRKAWGSAGKILVSCEITTSHIAASQRRMDILIEGNDYGLMIENKPWAMDQQEQLSDYAKHLYSRFPGKFVIVYLVNGGVDPSEQSIDGKAWQTLKASGNAISLDYASGFRHWLSQCEQVCRADSVRVALRDFGRYITQEFSPTVETVGQ